jgi:hypothetical protein
VIRRCHAGARLLVLCALPLAASGCDLAYPEIVVLNKTRKQIVLRNISFSGCAWSTVLADGEATSPGLCLPGEDRVHFEKLDASAYAVDAIPTWFSYQTSTVHRVGYGDFRVFELTADDMEQDFSVPGPYGH